MLASRKAVTFRCSERLRGKVNGDWACDGQLKVWVPVNLKKRKIWDILSTSLTHASNRCNHKFSIPSKTCDGQSESQILLSSEYSWNEFIFGFEKPVTVSLLWELSHFICWSGIFCFWRSFTYGFSVSGSLATSYWYHDFWVPSNCIDLWNTS